MTTNYAYYSEIKELEFYVLGTEENYIDAAVNITNKELFKGELPVQGGIYSPEMGTSDYSWNCQTCFNQKGKCDTHPGALECRYPVKSPLFKDNILKWLKVICFKCGRLVVNKEIHVAKTKLLNEYVKLAKNVLECPWTDCREPRPVITKDKYRPLVFYAEYGGGKNSRREELYNHHIRDILGRITDQTVQSAGKPVKCHPRNFILDIIRVPPNGVRPDIRRINGSRSNNSEITALMKNLVEIKEVLPIEIPPNNEINNNINQMYFNTDMTYYGMVKGSTSTNNQVRLMTTTNKTPMSIAARIPKKTGRIRKNLMGKRTRFMMRSVLSGDNTLRIDEIGIPQKLASMLQIPETVRSYNRDRLNIYFMNKRDIYPGCAGVHINLTNKFHKIEHLDPDYELQEGDVVMRDLIEGDYIGFNRQPSLLFGQIGSHKIKIMDKSDTIRINVSACCPYNADFDGDCGNGLVAQNIKSRNELAKMSWVGNWMVSYQNHAPYYGCFQDSLIGSAELTRSDVVIDKWHAMLLFSNITPPDESGFNFDKMSYTGRELIGKFMPKINYPKKKASIYLPQYAQFIKYDPDEIYVQINRGELISGTLDSSTVGQQVMGSIFHIINNEYGANAALETIHNFHQIVSRFFLWSGFTVGIRDINISEEALKKVREQIKAMEQEANAITERLNNRELIAPLGIKLDEYYEREQINALEPSDSFVTPILGDIDFHNNKLAQLIFTGSKGKKMNMIAINGSYGQITLNGKRPPRNFSWGRTGPYFQRYETSPVSLGYINTSYREGLRPESFPFAANDARFSSISLALSTAVSGYQSRISIKNLESIVVNNLRQAAKSENIVQILYTESGVDTRKTEAVKFLTALISDKEMNEQYRATPKMFNSAYHNKEVEAALNEEYKQLIEDRKLYREIFLWVENNNPGQYLIDHIQQMPINPYRIIEDVLYNYEDIINDLNKEQKNLDPIRAIKKINELCDNIPYMYFNSFYEKKKAKIPELNKVATTLLCILIRSYLCCANLARKKINNYHLDIIINKIKITFKNSLVDYGAAVGIIAAQCLSEPLTQFTIDSKHRSGGTGGTSFNAVERFKEILGAKPTENLKVPSMLIMVLPEYEKDKIKVQEIANHIEMMNFERFISSMLIFFESYGRPIHPEYKHEEKMISLFEKNNAGIKIPGNLSKWCIRYEINKEELIINSMKLDTIITKLRIKYPEAFIVYTPENSDNIIIRMYISQSMIKSIMGQFNENIIIDLAKKINGTIIRGVKNITFTEVTHIAKSEVQPDGSISSSKIYGITTLGTNLEDVLENPYVDKYRTQTNSITEFEEMYGIEAARQKIINEIRKTMPSDKITREHTSIFADEMTNSGKLSSIQKTGLQVREANNVTLRLSFQSPIQVIENAAINNIRDKIGGISGPLINGQAPSIGTLYNNVCIDEDFVEKYMKNLGKSIEDEL